jgi:hypothetical protein
MEYAAAKSTMCRQCGAAFSRPPQGEKSGAAHREQRMRRLSPWKERCSEKFDGCGASRAARSSNASMQGEAEVIGASSTNCPKCSAHLDLRDTTSTTSFSRAIRTHGEYTSPPRGDLSSSSVVALG